MTFVEVTAGGGETVEPEGSTVMSLTLFTVTCGAAG